MTAKRHTGSGLRRRPVLPDHRPAEPDHIARIAALSKSARATWFSLLGVLLFVGVTLLGFEHIDFYGYDRQTQLPLIGVSVPTSFFFYTAPLLVAANYVYFHLYLIRLWGALGAAPSRIAGAPLGRNIPPWLVTDAALWLRNITRKDDCADPRPLEAAAAVLNFILTWGFGLVISTMAWWTSAVARDPVMTGLALAALAAILVAGFASFNECWDKMTASRKQRTGTVPTICGLLIAGLLAFPTYFRTVDPAPWMYLAADRVRWNENTRQIETYQVPFPIFAKRDTPLADRFFTLAEIDLQGEDIVERPANWLPYDLARADYRREWCAREAKQDCLDFADDEARFESEFVARQRVTLAALQRPSWHDINQTKPDFRGANLQNSFLAGLNLQGARFHGASLDGADFQQANLTRAQLPAAHLQRAQFQSAVLSNAELQSTDIDTADFRGADLQNAMLQGTGGTGVQMTRTDLRRANLQGSRFSNADLSHSNLSHSDLRAAFFFFSDLSHTRLEFAQLAAGLFRDSQLRDASLYGAELFGTNFGGADLSRATLDYTILSSQAQNPSTAPFDQNAERDVAALALAGGMPLHQIWPLDRTIFSASQNVGGALRDIDFSDIHPDGSVDWSTVFLDGSVLGQDKLLKAMGITTPPCQWQAQILSADEFYGRWRGWIEGDRMDEKATIWLRVAPAGFEDVPAIAPPDGCRWPAERPPVTAQQSE